MFVLIAAIIVSFHSSAASANFETGYLRALARGKSSIDVEAARIDYERLKVAHSACVIQKREQLIPESCYEELALQNLAPAVLQLKIVKLDRLCSQIARRLTTSMRSSANLSPHCASEVREALALQDYRAEDTQEDWSAN